jgi:hypothetical protein
MNAAEFRQELSYRRRPELPDSLDVARESQIREDRLIVRPLSSEPLESSPH